jgi:hypothetical protein
MVPGTFPGRTETDARASLEIHDRYTGSAQ